MNSLLHMVIVSFGVLMENLREVFNWVELLWSLKPSRQKHIWKSFFLPSFNFMFYFNLFLSSFRTLQNKKHKFIIPSITNSEHFWRNVRKLLSPVRFNICTTLCSPASSLTRMDTPARIGTQARTRTHAHTQTHTLTQSKSRLKCSTYLGTTRGGGAVYLQLAVWAGLPPADKFCTCSQLINRCNTLLWVYKHWDYT